MNIKTTLFLLAMLIGIGAYFLFFEKGRETTDVLVPPPGSDNPVFIAEELFPDGAKTIELHWADGQRAQMTRDQAGRWSQTSPVKYPLNTIRVQAGLVNDAAMLRFVEKFTPDTPGKPTLAETDLAKPRASIRISGEYRDVQIDRDTGKPSVKTKPYDQIIHLGAGVTGSRGYIRINDDPLVYIVNNTLHLILLNERIADWRQRSLDVPTDAQADRITVQAQDRIVELMKVNGDWIFAPPLSDRIAPRAPTAILTTIRNIPVARFVDDHAANLATYGLDNPTAQVTIHTNAIEPNQRSLRIGGPADPAAQMYHASWSLGVEPSSVVFTITRDTRARILAIQADDIRDPRITPIKAAGISELKITIGEQPAVRLQKATSTGWSFATEPGQTLPPFRPDQDAVNQLIDTIANASAKYYRPSTGRPEKPIAVIEVSSRIGLETQDMLTLFTPPEGAAPTGDDTPFTMVLRNNEQTGYLVPTASIQSLLEPVIKLRDRQIIDVKPETIEKVTIKRSDGMSYTFHQFVPSVDPNARPQWQMVGADQFERDMFEYLVKQISTLRAETWLAETKPMGDSHSELIIDFKGRSPIVITCDLVDRHATVAGVDGQFLLSEQMRLLLDGEYRPRTVLALTPGDVTQVTITRKGARPWTIGKDDLNRYQALGPDGQPLTTAQVNTSIAARLFDSLMPLRVWRYVEKPETALISDATTTLEILTRTGQKHTVYIGFKDQPALAMCKDKWFTLHPETLSRLIAEPAKNE